MLCKNCDSILDHQPLPSPFNILYLLYKLCKYSTVGSVKRDGLVLSCSSFCCYMPKVLWDLGYPTLLFLSPKFFSTIQRHCYFLFFICLASVSDPDPDKKLVLQKI
jgi:hypothetical protein